MSKDKAPKGKASRDKSSPDKGSGKRAPKPGASRTTQGDEGTTRVAQPAAYEGERVATASGSAERAGQSAALPQWLYDMPYSAPPPRLISPELGLHNLVSRAGHNAGYTIDVTLLDTPDHRLLRSGVLLAHRVLDERGEWYLGAPEWQPLLPKERIQPMGQAELPEEFDDLVRPFRRRAALGPVAALTCERREFALRDNHGTTLALLRDDKVTVRRGGLTTARFREVMLTPTKDGLTDGQVAHLAQALAGAGATQVTGFPRLVRRLGAPATGLTDFPAPPDLGQDLPFGLFVSNLLATRVRQLLVADLAVRTETGDGAAELATRAAQLRVELQGLSSVMDFDWVEDLDEELEWVANQAEQDHLRRQGDLDGKPPGELKQRLRGERYLTLLERLVSAARAPKVGEMGASLASEVLGHLTNEAQGVALKVAGRLRVDSPAEAWEAAHQALDDLVRVSQVAGHLLPDRTDELRRLVASPMELLGEARRFGQLAQRSKELTATSTPAEAFDLGRSYEHEMARTGMLRDAFVRQWAKSAKKLER